jgi:hypothetical protein
LTLLGLRTCEVKVYLGTGGVHTDRLIDKKVVTAQAEYGIAGRELQCFPGRNILVPIGDVEAG